MSVSVSDVSTLMLLPSGAKRASIQPRRHHSRLYRAIHMRTQPHLAAIS